TVLPSLYANLTDRVGLKLVDDVADICREADENQMTCQAALDGIVERINKVFAGLEVSMFLEDREEEEGLYKLVAFRKVWEGPWTEKAEYHKGEGITGYVLDHGRSVR